MSVLAGWAFNGALWMLSGIVGWEWLNKPKDTESPVTAGFGAVKWLVLGLGLFLGFKAMKKRKA